MSEIEFKVEPKKFNLTIGEQKFPARFPFYGEAKVFEKDLREVGPEKAVGMVDGFLMKLGLPQEAIDQLDAETLKDLLVFVLGGKKK